MSSNIAPKRSLSEALTEAEIEDDWVNSSLEDDEKIEQQKNVENSDKKGNHIAVKNVDTNANAEMEEEMTMLRKVKQKFDWLKSITSGKQIQLLFPGPEKRSHIELTIRNCGELFAKSEFTIPSTRIKLFGIDFELKAVTKATDNQKGWLGLYLCVYPPSNYKGPYSVDLNCSLRVMNKLCQNDVRKTMDREYNRKDEHSGWGKSQIAKLETLLDRNNGFITEDGKIYVDVEFKIKSATMGHMLLLEEL